MKAIGYQQAGPIDRPDAFVDIELADPTPSGRDILVRVDAVSVNPVDYKIRSNVSPVAGEWKVIGWDACGEVVATGDQVTRFAKGDAVYYAGSLDRPGSNSQLHCVDERIVGHKPPRLPPDEAAALPLVAITAWEMLFDRLDIRRAVPGAAPAIVIMGGSGGVGSIAIQLVRALTDLTVVATASRPETIAWARKLGAHHVVDHSRPLAEAIAELGIGAPGFVFSTSHTDRHLPEIVEFMAPQGRFGLIDDPQSLDIGGFKRKSISVHWELMFTRPLYATRDMVEQGNLLDEVARLVDAGKLVSTVTRRYTPINADNLKLAHRHLESGKAFGKTVLYGF